MSEVKPTQNEIHKLARVIHGLAIIGGAPFYEGACHAIASAVLKAGYQPPIREGK